MRVLTLMGLLGCLLIASCKSDASEEEGVDVPPKHLFLLIGQSNMAGRGVVTEMDREVHPNIEALNREGEWVPAIDPIHFDKPVAGVGPGRSFAWAVMEASPESRIGLIPGAVGGSPISSWEPGGMHEPTNTHPYDDAVARAKRAMQSGELKAVLWHQGESDSNEEAAPIYKAKLIALIERLRGDLNAPEVPFLIGQLGQFDEQPWDEWRSLVNEAHIEVAEELEEVYFVPSTGLNHKGDMIHFSAEAEREFGKRYAQVYLEKKKN